MGRRRITRYGAIAVAGDAIDYTLHRVEGRRHVHLVLDDEGELQVRAPWRYSRAEAEAVIREHVDWVAKNLKTARELSARRPRLASGVELPLVDARLRLDIRRATLPRVARCGELLRVYAPAQDPSRVRALLEGWYREQARRHLASRMWRFADALRVHPQRLTVRGQRTRWGSCSSRGAISLNWRLMLLSSSLVDYVVVHELCHLRHMDHSPRFWTLVARAIPDMERRRRELQNVPSPMVL